MQAVGRTDQGMVREVNQDYIFTSTMPVGPLPDLFLVADGMGGHQAGDFASRFLVQNLVRIILILVIASSYNYINFII